MSFLEQLKNKRKEQAIWSGIKLEDENSNMEEKPNFPLNLVACGSGVYGRLCQGSIEAKDSFSQCLFNISDDSTSAAVKQVACGAGHNIALISTKYKCNAVENKPLVYTWGKCHYGQLGHGKVDCDRWVATEVKYFAVNNIEIETIAAGDSFCVAVSNINADDNCQKVYTWGCGYFHALGTGSEATQTKPIQIQLPTLSTCNTSSTCNGGLGKIVKVACGGFHTLLLTDIGIVVGFGRNDFNQLGVTNGRIVTHPLILPFTQNSTKSCTIVDVAAGYYHSALITDNGEAILLRKSNKTEDIVINNITSTSNSKNKDTNFGKLIAASCGKIHTLLLNSSGELFLDNGSIELHLQQHMLNNVKKDDSNAIYNVPSTFNLVEYKHEAKITKISSGSYHCLAITEANELYGWGCNNFGKLGVSSGSPIKKPVLMIPGGSFSTFCCFAASAGANSTIAIIQPQE